MCHFIKERELVAKNFKHAKIFSSTAHSEGVDLSHLKHYIIYSEGYSGAKHIQREDRIVNVNGSNTTTVHYILVHHAISDQAYEMCSKKKDFNNKSYTKRTL